MKGKWKENLRNFVSREIAIEYKSCLYFSCLMFFYFVYLLCRKIPYAGVGDMFEMILAVYFMVYLQVYLFGNFDEAEWIGKKDALGALVCTSLHTAVSYAFNWYGRIPWVTALFFAYMLLVYFFVYLCNKIKRMVDTENLNRMLAEFKKGDGGFEGKCH